MVICLDNTIRAAIYSRKSHFSGRGESIGNQIEFCTKYLYSHFPDKQVLIEVFEDEDFSGGTIKRPQLQEMLSKIRCKQFDIVICYRLDRISRDVSDFSQMVKELNHYGTEFISITEQFDTTTPMGRAMMMTAAVFAQLERELASERIRDNMYQLAKTGRWLGGTSPIGYRSIPCEQVSVTGKTVQLYHLDIVEEDAKIYQLITTKYLELRSLAGLEKYLIQNDIKTKNGKNFAAKSLQLILQNLTYVTADATILEFLLGQGYLVPEEIQPRFTGEFAVMSYNKRDHSENKTRFKPIEEWIISVGMHKPLIDSDRFIKIQKLLKATSKKVAAAMAERQVKSSEALFSGLLKCSFCGSYMRPKRSTNMYRGHSTFYYMCELKEKSKKSKCACPNVHGNKLDEIVIRSIHQVATNGGLKEKIMIDSAEIEFSEITLKEQLDKTESEIKAIEEKITNLADNFSVGSLSKAAIKAVSDKIDICSAQLEQLQQRKEELLAQQETTKHSNTDLTLIQEMLTHFSLIETLPIQEKRQLLRIIINQLLWNGDTVNVELFKIGKLPPKKV